MQVPSIFQPSFVALPPLHQWPRPLKRAMLVTATILCISTYVLLMAGLIGLLAVSFDLISRSF